MDGKLKAGLALPRPLPAMLPPAGGLAAFSLPAAMLLANASALVLVAWGCRRLARTGGGGGALRPRGARPARRVGPPAGRRGRRLVCGRPGRPAGGTVGCRAAAVHARPAALRCHL